MGTDADSEFFIPVHHQTFQLSREPLLEPIERFHAAAGKHSDRIVITKIGQEFRICPAGSASLAERGCGMSSGTSRLRRAGCRAVEEQFALAGVPGERRRALELRPGLVEAAQLEQKVAAHARQAGDSPASDGSAVSASTSSSPACGPNAIATATARLSSTTGDGVTCGERRRRARAMRAQSVSSGVQRARVAGGDRRLQRVRAARAAELARRARARRGRGGSAADPSARGSDRAAGSARPTGRRAPASATPGSPSARRGRGPRARAEQLGQDAAEPQRILAERRPHPVVAGGRRVALVEDEIDHLEHRRQARGELGAAGHFERDLLLGEGPLGADDPLRDGRLGDEERARDLVGRQAAEQAQRERHARLGREHRMARGEHEAQQVVADVVVERRVEIRRRGLLLGRRARGRAPRACARAACSGGADRSRDASPWP